MKFRIALPALVTLLPLMSLFAAEANNPEALQERIIAHARTVAAEDYAYTRTVRSESIERDKTEERVMVERWDPTRPLEQRWTLISINAQPPTPEQLTSYRKEVPKRRQAHYGRVAGYFAKPATTSVDARGRTISRFAARRNRGARVFRRRRPRPLTPRPFSARYPIGSTQLEI